MTDKRKLAELFKGLAYASGKVTTIDSNTYEAGYHEIKQMVELCKAEINKRFSSSDVIEGLSYRFQQIQDIVDVLDHGLTEPDKSIQEKAINALRRSLTDRVDELKRDCQDLDEDSNL